MQYKIPVQIENEDPIFLGLSLRQLIIIMIGFSIAYGIFQSLSGAVGEKIALLPSGLVAIIAVTIAVFKVNEMTFVPFVMTLVRHGLFQKNRVWDNGVDSHQPIDVGFLSSELEKNQENVDMKEKIHTIEELQEKLKKI